MVVCRSYLMVSAGLLLQSSQPTIGLARHNGTCFRQLACVYSSDSELQPVAGHPPVGRQHFACFDMNMHNQVPAAASIC